MVDDLPDVRLTLSGLLSDEGYEVCPVSSRAEALQAVDAGHFHVAVLDVRLDETDEENREGLLLMREIKEKDPNVAIIILTGYADVQMVRDALQPDRDGKSTAYGFLEKTEVEQLPACVERALAFAKSNDRGFVVDLIAQGESERVEFKSSLRWDFEKKAANRNLQQVVAKTIAGMLNGEGGTLLIGVADDGTVIGIARDLATLRKRNVDGFEQLLTDTVKTFLGIECMPYVHPRFETIEGQTVCVVSVAKSPDPVFLTAGDAHQFWVRMGNSTRSLDVKETLCYIQARWGRAA